MRWINDIANWLKQRKRIFFKKSPYQKFCLVRDCNNLLLSVVGCNFMHPTYRKNVLTLIPAALITDYFTLMFYTIYYYGGQPLQATKSTTLSSLILPVNTIKNKSIIIILFSLLLFPFQPSVRWYSNY